MIDPKEAVFVDVDTQFDFAMPGGALYVPGAEKLLPNMKRLVEFAKTGENYVLASVDTHVPGDPEFEQWPPHCVKGTQGHEKVPETLFEPARRVENRKQDIAPQPGEELVIEKSIYSLFDNVNTEPILEAIGKKDFVVFGLATDYCVKAAALGLIERGYRVTLVSDAIAAVDPETGEKALAELRDAGASFVTTDELLSA